MWSAKSIEESQKLSLEALVKSIPERDEGLLYWQTCDGRITPRPFQETVLDEVSAIHLKKMVVSAEIYCAGGKTILAALAALPHLQAGKKVIFVSPKRDAFAHFKREFERVLYPDGVPVQGVPKDAVAARFETNEWAFPFTEQVYIVTPYDLVDPYASPKERISINKALSEAALIILDEVHRMPEDKEEDTKIIGKVEPLIKAHAKNAKVLTLTGTHYRADGKTPFGVKEPDIVRTCQTLIMEKCLPNLYGCPVPISGEGLTGVEKLPNYLGLKFSKKARVGYLTEVVGVILKTVEIEANFCGSYTPCGHAIFVCNQEDARFVCELLNEKLGKNAFVSYTSDDVTNSEKQEVQEKLRDGRLLGYATVMMGAESINVPRLKYAHLVARITSPNKLMQAVGRVMRLPNASDTDLIAVKDKAVVVDYQVRKKRILKLALGIRELMKLGGSKLGNPKVGGGMFVSGPAEELPDGFGLDLASYERWLANTGEELTADEKRQLLLDFPQGCKRPSVMSLDEFEAVLRDIRPELLAMKRDELEALKASLEQSLQSYVSSGGRHWNVDFNIAVRQLHPQWFPTRKTEESKSQLIAMPIGCPRPSSSKHPLGQTLCWYTSKSSTSYDAEFDKAIRKRQPGWFEDTADTKKAALLAMPVGSPRPNKKNSLGSPIRNYTSKSKPYYDAEFDKEIRSRQPTWFSRTHKAKIILLRMPVKCKRPSVRNHPMGHNLSRYTNQNHGCYDSEFDKAIKKRQPQWFENSSESKKAELLAMPAGCKRPNKKNSLGSAIRNYISQNSHCYDSEFEKAIRKRQPQWFKQPKQTRR